MSKAGLLSSNDSDTNNNSSKCSNSSSNNNMLDSPLIALLRRSSLEELAVQRPSLADAPLPRNDEIAERSSNMHQDECFLVSSSTLLPAHCSNLRVTSPSNRRRKKQICSFTVVKGHQRNHHNYATYDPDALSMERVRDTTTSQGKGLPAPFPVMLHTMLQTVEEAGLTDIVSWQPHGRAFAVHDIPRFVQIVLPQFFQQQHKYTSFQRQLSLYGFIRLTRKGPDYGAYYHELFLRNRAFLCFSIQKIRLEGTIIRTHQTEPDLYRMPAVEAVPTPGTESRSGAATATTNTTEEETALVAASPQMNHYVSKGSTGVQTQVQLNPVLAEPQGQSDLHSMVGIHNCLEPIPQSESSHHGTDVNELAFFLDRVDFYSLENEASKRWNRNESLD